MQTKLIIAGVGVASAAVGAVFGWAITADRYEQQLKMADGVIEVLENKLHLINNPDFIEYNQADVEATAKMFSDPRVNPFIRTDFDAEGFVDGVQSSSDKIAEMRAKAEEANPDKFVELVEEAITEGDRIAYDKVSEVVEEIKQAEATIDEVKSEEDELIETLEEEMHETPEETRSNLQKIIEKYTADPEEVQEFIRQTAPTLDRGYVPPFVIAKDKYAWDEEEGDEYSKITITYYEKARLLLDEDQEIIKDVDSTVGWRNLKQFGGDSGDPDIVYIRNRRMETDFEVVRTDEKVPLHIEYGMGKEEFRANKASGLLKLRPEDE